MHVSQPQHRMDLTFFFFLLNCPLTSSNSKFLLPPPQWYASPDYNLFGPYVEHRKSHPGQLFYILHPGYMWRLWDLIQSNTQENIQPNPPSSGFIGEYTPRAHICTNTHTHTGETQESPYRCLCTLISQFPLPIMVRRRGYTLVLARAHSAGPWRRRKMMNFLSWPCTVTLSACGPAPQCTANCRCRWLVAGGVQTSARPADPPSCQRALDVGGFHQFQSVFFPYTALEQSTRRWQEQLLTSGLTHHFFFFFRFLSHVWLARRIFLLPPLDA